MKLNENNVEKIINLLSQNNYTFGEGELSDLEIRQIKKQSKDSRGIYGVNAPIGINVFSFIAQNEDVVFQLQDFEDSDLDAMIIKYSPKSERKYIVINSAKPLINQVFAAVHEFYHYQYSFTGNTKESFICSFNKKDKEEIKANRFAAEFLLPEEALKSELDSFFKFQSNFEDALISKQIVFCFSLVIKYALPLKAVLYRLKEENITSTDFLFSHYADVKCILLEMVNDFPLLKDLYSNSNKYVHESLYDLVPLLYNKGRLDDSTLNNIIKQFDLSESQIKEGLISNE